MKSNAVPVPLSGKNVLLISPRFFGYEQEITRKLTGWGAQVQLVLDKPSNTNATKALVRVAPGLLTKAMGTYVDEICRQHGGPSVDYVLVVKGEALDRPCLEKLRRSMPSAKFVYYNWDSFRNYPHLSDLLPYYDECFSFDLLDSESIPALQHLPLFYTDRYRDLPTPTDEIDLFSVASVHSDRYPVTQRIVAAAPEDSRVFTYFFYPSKPAYLANSLFVNSFRGPKINQVQWQPISPERMLTLLSQSRIIIDVQHPGQSGLTMRTLETVGAKKKLITTNALVKHYDFYREENILVVDREKPYIPNDFFYGSYQPLPADLYAKYSLDGWLHRVLGIPNVIPSSATVSAISE